MTEIRKAKVADAVSLIELFKQLDSETEFMLFEPGERVITIEQQVARLNAFESSPTEAMFVAENEGTVFGFCVCIGSPMRRNRHSASVVIGVLQKYWNQGLGRQLLQSAEVWAKAKGIHRLELSVMAHNANAIALYGKCGFEREGIRRDALRVNGKFVNELYMSKLI